MCNRENKPKLCPFQTRSETTHIVDRIAGYFATPGVTTLPNKEVTNTYLLHCVGENCMAWDSTTQQCKRLK